MHLQQQLQFIFDSSENKDGIIEVNINSKNKNTKSNRNRNFIFGPEDEEKERLVKWVLHECIARYYEMSLRSKTLNLPSMTSGLSDMPKSSNEFRSSTESVVLKKVAAVEWLEIFHENLSYLPQLHKDLIQKKYLIRSKDGRYPNDDSVYEGMHLSRSVYYRLKKEALYWLALQLAEEEIMGFKDVI